VITEFRPGFLAEPGATPSVQRVEIIGTHLRISGGVQLQGFRRISDFFSLQTGSVTLHDVTLLNRRGMPTADELGELSIRLADVTLITQRVAPASVPASEDVQIEKEPHRILAVTIGHLVEGTVSIYPGASLMGYLQASDPPFLPLLDVRVRWLADRRLHTKYEFVLLNRSQVVAVTGLD